MLPVSAWPPGPPGASLSPFGKPRRICLNNHPRGYVIPKGAWIVATTSNTVVMFTPKVDPWDWVSRTPGTGYLPGQIPPARCPPRPCPPKPPRFQKHDVVLEEWRAWQRKTGDTNPPIRPTPGRRPPNWFGWRFTSAPRHTLVPFFSGGTVLADGQNVVLTGGGFATITQAFSV